MLIDSHCHLNYKGLVEQQADVLQRARDAGVGGFLNISTRQSEWSDVLHTAEREPDVWASVGIHPHEADAHADLNARTLAEAAGHRRVVALGETGLDYFYDRSERDAQQASFRRHIAVAREAGLPVIIHTRDAEADTANILREELDKGQFGGVIHCFTGTPAFARAVIDMGLTISFSGIVTFKNAKELQQVATEIPIERMLVETDSPFLAPVPFRGKVCEPAFVRQTAEFIAQLRGIRVEELAAKTNENFHVLFSRAFS